MIALLAACALAAPGLHTASADLPREGRGLPVRATWADGDAPMPVIVLSHGLGGSRDAYDPLAEAWARAGYLVVQPTHPDSLAFRTRAERLAFVKNPKAYLEDPKNLGAFDDRVVEVGLVLDRVDGLAAMGLDPSRIDKEHVGIAGHSFGAHTAMLCGGLTLAGADYREERADAVILLSPQGTGAGITRGSFAAITLPTLVVTGSQDNSPRTGQGPEWRLEAWEGLGASDRWLLWLEGATHDLGGISGLKKPDEALLGAVVEATTRFWDATLGGDAAARARLDTGSLDHGSRARLDRGTATNRDTPSEPVTTD